MLGIITDGLYSPGTDLEEVITVGSPAPTSPVVVVELTPVMSVEILVPELLSISSE